LVVVLGLLSAITWGLGDFSAGVVGRRAAVAGVLLGSQLAGAAIALLFALALGEAAPTSADVGWALASSLVGGTGIACLYVGLSRGRMGVVAPLAGVLAAATPAVAGILLQGVPPAPVLVGIGLAVASVLVVSRVGAAEDGRPSGAAWGIGAGLGLGLVAITLSRLGQGEVFAPLAVMRLGEAAIIGLILAVGGRRIASRVPRRLWLAVAAVGVLDMLGTGFYIAAAHAGALAIAGVLSALYPVTTVVLAVTVLREPLARWHLLGIAVAGAAIVLITMGGA